MCFTMRPDKFSLCWLELSEKLFSLRVTCRLLKVKVGVFGVIERLFLLPLLQPMSNPFQHQFESFAKSTQFYRPKHKISDKEYFQFVWSRISSSLQILFQQRPREICGMQLYSHIYELCTKKPSTLDVELYEALRMFISNEATKCRIQICQAENILEQYAIQWKVFCRATQTLFLLAAYLTRVLESDNEKLDVSFHRMPLKQLFLKIWRENVLIYAKVYSSNCIVATLLAGIAAERMERAVNSQHITLLIKSFIECDCDSENFSMYRDEIERPLIEETCAFYQERIGCILDLPIAKYLERSCAMLVRERSILEKYFHVSSCEPTLKRVNEILLDAKNGQIVDAFHGFLQVDSAHDLHTSYFLFRGVEGSTKVLIEIFESFYIVKGKECLESLCTNLQEQQLFDAIVHQLQQIKRHNDFLLKECFLKDFNFESAIEKTMKTLVNDKIRLKNGNSICMTQILLTHLESLHEHAESTAKLHEFFVLFKYINDKDYFAKNYSITMANRLIRLDKKLFPQFDTQVIMEMKRICGIDFVLNLQKMLSDYQLYHGSNTPLSFGYVSPSILTKTAWPTYSQQQNLNASIAHALSNREKKMLSQFEQFYASKFQGRRLEWMHCMSTLEVAYGKKMIELPLVHFLVLELFSMKTPCANTWKNLLSLSRLPEEHFSLAMHDLVRHGLVSQREENNFVLSMEQCPQRLSIPLPEQWLFAQQTFTNSAFASASSEKASLSGQSNSYHLAEEKRQLLQSAIVRIMKREKEAEHSFLLQALKQEMEKSKISLSPDTASIKQAIEFLIDKQYIERDPLKHDSYLYVA